MNISHRCAFRSIAKTSFLGATIQRRFCFFLLCASFALKNCLKPRAALDNQTLFEKHHISHHHLGESSQQVYGPYFALECVYYCMICPQFQHSKMFKFSDEHSDGLEKLLDIGNGEVEFNSRCKSI